MAKTQRYSIVFNTAQISADAAMYSVGSNLNLDQSIRNHIQSEIILGNVTDLDISLSDDGLTLSVERAFTDAAYNALMEISPEAEIVAAINNMEHVDSVTYGFSDS